LHNTLGFIAANDDVWLGWTWWAAGPWYTEYMFSIEPENLGQPTETDSVVMPVLKPYFANQLDADYNDNGVVDAADYTIWRNSSGAVGAGFRADANLDGRVDLQDYGRWRASYGIATAGSGRGAGVVPEPATGVAIFWVASVLLLRRRTREVWHVLHDIGIRAK
jgi:hypothetical protein